MCVPLKFGSGTRIKILEALTLGVIVVSTSKGIEGIELLKKKKDSTQPSKIKTGGSTFKNPINKTNEKVWKLIEKSVPLSTVFGDAAISNKHCNFLVNKGNASFDDMIKLINFVSKNVLNKTGIKLEKEIKILE